MVWKSCPDCGNEGFTDKEYCCECGGTLVSLKNQEYNTENENDIATPKDHAIYKKSRVRSSNAGHPVLFAIMGISTLISGIASIVFFHKAYKFYDNLFGKQYVGGDAYNAIINSQMFTGHAVVAVGFLILTLFCLVVSYYFSKEL